MTLERNFMNCTLSIHMCIYEQIDCSIELLLRENSEFRGTAGHVTLIHSPTNEGSNWVNSINKLEMSMHSIWELW